MKQNMLAIIFLLNAHSLFAQTDVFKAAWVTSPVTVDGDGAEWGQPLRYYDADTKLSFAFANDDKNLYLCFQTTDDRNQIKIMRAGMEISLNIKGDHKASIYFPLEQKGMLDEPKNENRDGNGTAPFKNGNGFRPQNDSMELKGFTTRNGLVKINDSSGIHIAISKSREKKFTYEIAIPLKELFGANYTTADLLKNISLEAKINAMKGMSHPGTNTSFSGRETGGKMNGGGRMGGAGGHHNKDAGNTERNDTEEVQEDKTDMDRKASFKQKFILAENDRSSKG